MIVWIRALVFRGKLRARREGHPMSHSVPRVVWRSAAFAAVAAAVIAAAWWLNGELGCDPLVAADGTSASMPSAPCTYCLEPPSPDCTLCVTQSPLLIANAAGSASTTLRLCNMGPEEPSLALAVKALSVPVDASAAYQLSPPQPTLAPTSEAERDVFSGQKKLKKDECVQMKLDVAGVANQGVHTTTLYNGGTPLATLKAVRLDFPFALRPVGPHADRFEAEVGPSRAFAIPIYNEDPFRYRFAWRLELDGRVQSGVDEVAGQRHVVLKPLLDAKRACWLESGFLRAGARSGKLILQHAPDPSFSHLAMKQKVIDIGVKVNYFAPNRQRVVNAAFILLVLFAGIGASLLLNYAWPMYRRRFAIKQRLAQQDGRLAGIGGVAPPGLLSLMRIEKRRLREELRARWSFDPETESALDALEPRVQALSRRIELTAKAGETLKAINDDPLLAQYEVDEAERLARQVFQAACMDLPSATDLERAEAALAGVAAVRARRDNDPPAERVKELHVRTEAVGRRLADLPQTADLPMDLLTLLAGLRVIFLRPDETAPSRERFVDAANAVAKAEAIRVHVDLLDSADPVVRVSRLDRVKDVLATLRPGPDAGMRLAACRDVLDQVEQNVTETDILDEVKANKPGALTIAVDPPTPRDYQLVTFRVRLRRAGLDDATARERIRWHWSINGIDLHDAEGWIAWHFFEPEARGVRLRRWFVQLLGGSEKDPPRRFEVVAEAFDRDGPSEPIAIVRRDGLLIEGTKTYAENARAIAVTGLFTTVLLAGIALLATAQDKVQALDWMTATAVVFGLGFAADVLKRAVRKS